MTAFVFNEGVKLIFDQLHRNITTDRGVDLEIGLFTNNLTVPDLLLLPLTSITEPTGGGYARKPLLDTAWDNSIARKSVYAKQTFTATGGAMTGTIYGWFICTKTGTTNRVLYGGKFDDAPSGIVLADNSSISYTPSFIF